MSSPVSLLWIHMPIQASNNLQLRMKACRTGVARMWNSWVRSVQWNAETPTQLASPVVVLMKNLTNDRLKDHTHLFLTGPSPENPLSVWAECRGLSALQLLAKSPDFTPDPLRCPFTKEPGIKKKDQVRQTWEEYSGNNTLYNNYFRSTNLIDLIAVPRMLIFCNNTGMFHCVEHSTHPCKIPLPTSKRLLQQC